MRIHGFPSTRTHTPHCAWEAVVLKTLEVAGSSTLRSPVGRPLRRNRESSDVLKVRPVEKCYATHPSTLKFWLPDISQCSNARLRALFRTLDAGGEIEGVGMRPQPSLCICTVIVAPSPYSRFYDPEDCVSCGYLLAFRKINESAKPKCVRFQA
ncbi:hypothetical protein M405DRAFT_207820 [Rhizopogon salebrosus TDB-379]|nr:hypothetical protein M405DRAFT_207820 [Rhizopogon salebrosus TDB-379]